MGTSWASLGEEQVGAAYGYFGWVSLASEEQMEKWVVSMPTGPSVMDNAWVRRQHIHGHFGRNKIHNELEVENLILRPIVMHNYDNVLQDVVDSKLLEKRVTRMKYVLRPD
ncbi:hypothetical protein FH972_005729 [Carpinus fangiana]|uniref:Uncharacterized protein n=1 Tax=Carpinus fangiana TaxID=176857 RepID=A0A5N6QTN1_9ROSI|nr:hypothetical protein FH972_005729 [Carpinus fangiana]